MTLPIYFILGPTGIGKSALAIKIASKIKGQIINADSMQVYKDLCVLTARPSIKEMNIINHHLYGYVNGSERYNVARWCKDAAKILNNFSKNNIPTIVVGGTGMYIDKLINGLVELPSIPEEYKKKSEDLILKKGIKNFYNIVKKNDLNSVKNINSNDVIRLKRIWEVYEYTKTPLSIWIKNKNKKFLKNSNHLLYLFLPDRKMNYERVNNRFVKMIENGAIDEVKKMKNSNLNETLPIMKAHGVPEISLYLEKKIDLSECIKKGQKITRNYVKRQHTWWNSSNLNFHQELRQFPDKIDLKSIHLS